MSCCLPLFGKKDAAVVPLAEEYLDKTIQKLSTIYSKAEVILKDETQRIQKFLKKGGSLLRLLQRAVQLENPAVVKGLMSQNVAQLDWSSEKAVPIFEEIIQLNSELAKQLLAANSCMLRTVHVKAALTLDHEDDLASTIFQLMVARAEQDVVYQDETYNSLLLMIKELPILATEMVEKTSCEMSYEHLDEAIMSGDHDLIQAVYQKLDKKELSVHCVALVEHLLASQESCEFGILFYFIFQENAERVETLLDTTHFSNEEKLSAIVLAQDLKANCHLTTNKIPTLLETAFSEIAAFAGDFRRLKWGYLGINIKAPFFIKDEVFHDSGFYSKLIPFHTSFLFYEFAAQNPGWMSDELGYALDLLADPLTTLGNLLEQAETDKPILLRTGWHRHSTYIAFYKGMMVKCNRGDKCGDKPGVQVFTFDRDKLTPEVIAKVLAKQDPDYFLTGIDADIDAEALYYLPQKKQTSGNCTWASMKSMIFGVTFMQNLDKLYSKDLEKDVVIARALERSRDAYKLFTLHTRKQIFGELVRPFLQGTRLSRQFEATQAQKLLKNMEKQGRMISKFYLQQKEKELERAAVVDRPAIEE